MIKIGYKLLTDDAKPPEMSYEGSNNTMGVDVYTSERTQLLIPTSSNLSSTHPHKSILPYANLRTGIQLYLPDGVHLSWGGRSGLAFKNGRIAFEGKIDSNYTGELAIKLWSMNPDDDGFVIPAGTKIAQLYVVHYHDVYELEETNDVRESSRGSAGFGSTG